MNSTHTHMDSTKLLLSLFLVHLTDKELKQEEKETSNKVKN